MKLNKYLLLIIKSLLLASCLTTGESRYYESFSLDKDESVEIDTEVELPGVSLFISAPFPDETEQYDDYSQVDLVIPESNISEVDIEPLQEEEIVSLSDQSKPSPVNVVEPATESPAVRNPVKAEENPPKPAPVVRDPEPEVNMESSSVITHTPVAVPVLIDREVDEDIAYSSPPLGEQVESSPGEEIVIAIDREGWIFDSSLSSEGVEFRKREFADGKTRFVFFPRESGNFVLVFLLQNSQTGNEEKMTYNLRAFEEESSAHIPIVIDPSSTESATEDGLEPDSTVKGALEEGNVPGVIASFDQLTDPETDPGSDLLVHAFDLLEKQGGYDDYLVDLAEQSFHLYPYDHNSAEMLYRAAQALENPGISQDIEKAVLLFKMVRDYFPLSMYSDRAEERIRYLERHFMKIY